MQGIHLQKEKENNENYHHIIFTHKQAEKQIHTVSAHKSDPN